MAVKMAHFAEIKDGVVDRVVVVDDAHESDGPAWCENFFGGGTWVQTSYNNRIRKQFAGKGFTYDELNDVFVVPQPYPSWTLNATFDWEPPTPRPDDGLDLQWDEAALQWVAG